MPSSSAGGSKPRLAIIGLDSATWDVIHPLVEQGKLPAIARLMQEGRWGPLRSVIPPVTPPAWATLLTGRNPGVHGIYGMSMVERAAGNRIRPVTMADWHAEPLWAQLNRGGLTTGFLGVPFTFPPPTVQGWSVAGIMGTPTYNERMFSPARLHEPVTAAAGAYPLDPPRRVGGRIEFDKLQRQIDWLQQASCHLLEREPVDVFMVVENYTDHIGHYFFQESSYDHPGCESGLLTYTYEAADRLIGAVREAVGEACRILVVSDHGMGPLEGFLNLEAALPLSAPATSQSLLRVVRRAATAVLPRRWLLRLSRSQLAPPKAGRYFQFEGQTVLAPTTDGAMWVLSEEPEVRRRTAAALMEKLASLEHPTTGEPLFAPVAGEEQYHGARTHLAPDLLAWPANQAHVHLGAWARGPMPLFQSVEEVARLGAPLGYAEADGSHRLEGIFLTNAELEAPAEGAPALPRQLEDVAGFCLRACGLEPTLPPTESDPSGRGDGADTYTEDEARMLEQRLSDLGYT